jgi:ABC-2 type transport system permease protein
LAKVWANSFIVVTGAMFSLFFAVKWVIGSPIHGSTILFFFGTVVFLYATTALGVFLATIAKNQPQAGLLSMPIIVPIAMLDGGTTPLESMPRFLQIIMKFAPTPHYSNYVPAYFLEMRELVTSGCSSLPLRRSGLCCSPVR